jgi:predicted transcriptional regulator
VARISWFDDKAEHEAIQERVSKLDSFTSALADGVVSKQELSGQEQRLVAAMKTVEGELSDDVHSKVTKVLVELTAYNIMRLLHELQSERARMALGNL